MPAACTSHRGWLLLLFLLFVERVGPTAQRVCWLSSDDYCRCAGLLETVQSITDDGRETVRIPPCQRARSSGGQAPGRPGP